MNVPSPKSWSLLTTYGFPVERTVQLCALLGIEHQRLPDLREGLVRTCDLDFVLLAVQAFARFDLAHMPVPDADALAAIRAARALDTPPNVWVNLAVSLLFPPAR